MDGADGVGLTDDARGAFVVEFDKMTARVFPLGRLSLLIPATISRDSSELNSLTGNLRRASNSCSFCCSVVLFLGPLQWLISNSTSCLTVSLLSACFITRISVLELVSFSFPNISCALITSFSVVFNAFVGNGSKVDARLSRETELVVTEDVIVVVMLDRVVMIGVGVAVFSAVKVVGSRVNVIGESLPFVAHCQGLGVLVVVRSSVVPSRSTSVNDVGDLVVVAAVRSDSPSMVLSVVGDLAMSTLDCRP